MIQDREIEEFGTQNDLTPQEVEKDYVHGWLLAAIYSRPLLASTLILKGGNGLRKGYLANTRFSKDLDFSTPEHIDQALLESELREVAKIVEAKTAVRFLDKAVIASKDLPFNVDALEARMYFKGFYNEEKVDLKTQLDITQFDKMYLPVQNRPILHPYSDQADLIGMMRCQKAEEILASKLTTLLHRRKAGDLFDLLFGIVTGGYEVSRREVVTTFLRKSIFEPNPELARAELLRTPLAEYGPIWNRISVPRLSLLGFDMVTQQFPLLINSLFDSIVQAAAPFAPRGVGSFSSSRPSRVGRSFSSGISIFNNAVRQTIISAGQARRMIEMTYGGYRRLIEPYKFEYYVRKSDGTGNEYFWGYDTSGGSSGTLSIKQFFCDKIQDARVVDRTFNPRYPVEF